MIMKEARNRTESIYIDNDSRVPICIPMLPPELSKDLMSLNADQNVFDMSFYYWYDELSGELLNMQIKEEVIKVAANFDYSEYDKIIRHGKDIIKHLKKHKLNSYIIGEITKGHKDVIVSGEFNWEK